MIQKGYRIVCLLLFVPNLLFASPTKNIKHVGVMLFQQKGSQKTLLIGARDGIYSSFQTSEPVFFSDLSFPIWGFISTEVKAKNQPLREIAASTLKRATQKQIDLDPSVFLSLPRVYAKNTRLQLYCYRDDKISLKKLNQKLASVRKRRNLPSDRREFAYFEQLPIKNLLKAIDCVKQNRYPQANTACYQVKIYPKRFGGRQRGALEQIYLDKTYLDALAYSEKAFRKTLDQIFRESS